MQAIINGEMYEVEPAVEAYVKDLQAENEEQRREILRQWDKIKELEQENARLEEGYQKSLGVIAATDCEECKNKVYRKAYNDVMNIRANIQEIIEDIERGADNETD